MPGEKDQQSNDFATLARLALTGDRRDAETFVRRLIKRYRESNPVLANELGVLLAAGATPAAPMREMGGSVVPVDRDSRLQLLRHESPVLLDHDPILDPHLASALNQVLAEHRDIERLVRNDLKPTRTLLFTGKPGVGKTLTARWLAASLKKPLLTLDLSTVISSYLGRTGANLRHVLDYAKGIDAVLLLDEFDAIAKRRGDEAELGELKRLVTVVLQEIDLWPSDHLLVAATNHGELLDRAVWRRFDVVLEFPLPDADDVRKALDSYFADQAVHLGKWRQVLLEYFRGQSVSEIERCANGIRRRMVIGAASLDDALLETLGANSAALPLRQRKAIGQMLIANGVSDHQASRASGLARDTLRSMRREGEV